MIEAFTIAFIIALLSEIVDKTQLVILGLALKYKSPLKVFFGALMAHAFMDGIAIVLGTYLGFSLSSNLIKNIIGILFLVLGGWMFIKLYFLKKPKNKKKKTPLKTLSTPLIASFLIVMASEFGDKTQIASGLLAAKYLVPIPIFIGFISALAIAIGLNIFVGSKIAEKIPNKSIKIITGILFILFGIFTLLT